MPSRSYYKPTDFSHIELLLLDLHGESYEDYLSVPNRELHCPLINEDSLAAALGIDLKILKNIAHRASKHYRNFKITQKNNKIRSISAPRTYLKVIQWWILDNLLAQSHWPECVQGFIAGRSALTNARFHSGAKHIVNIDVKDFFPSISDTKVNLVFEELGYRNTLSRILTKLCTLHGALPQGAPTSPALANLASREMDIDFIRLGESLNCKYTRYADDITFSSEKRIDADIVSYSSEILSKYGLRANHSKTRVTGKGGRLEVTGFVINDTPQLPRAWRKRVRAILHQASLSPNSFSERKKEVSGYISMYSSFSDNKLMIESYKKILNAIPDK
ncbi:reverse transcriptase family protein [Azospirillum largimobile]